MTKKSDQLKTIPSERLRVFISSAQEAEGNIDWTSLRKKINKKLSECPYLNPIIIENVSSAEPTNQFMENEIRKADYVILLVSGEVRVGTRVEYTAAMKYGKKLHAYFINSDKRNETIKQLTQTLQDSDYCVYRKVDSFDNIDQIVLEDLIEDCIRLISNLANAVSRAFLKSI